MLKRYNIIFSIFIFFICNTSQAFDQKIYTDLGKDFKDVDWNLVFFQSHKFPRKDSVRWLKENKNNFLRFRLQDKDIGYASTDRKLSQWAPYMERAELTQRIGLKKSKYLIFFDIRIIDGFTNKEGEVFFQIHQENKLCKIGPILKFQFKHTRLILSTINKKGTHKDNYVGLFLPEFLKKWSKFKIIYDAENNLISLFINNRLLSKNIKHSKNDCGTPYLKFGIYRKGNLKTPNEVSIIDFDNFKIFEVIK